MAITPNNYPFNGGAFINGSNTPVNREDIHTLTLTKGGSSLGQYNPIIGDTTIDIPSDASDDTSTFTKASGDTSSMASGSKLSALFTAISSFFASMLSTIGGKADKVQGAPAGNLASLDANGNLANSGKKATDFKTKQTAVADPTVDGTGLSFINSVTQNANGEITPHKKTVQDGSTTQKGVVQLQDSIGSTESVIDRAVTPHAVRAAIDAAVSSAYHAAGTKTVAQLTSSLLIAENEGCVYNVTDSGTTTSDFVDGAGHPINAGDNVGVCDAGGGVYKFDLLSGFVDLSNYLTKTGDASNTTSTFTKNASDTSSMTSGSKLSAIFTAISNVFASFKALAFKDTVGTSDIADDAITAAKVKDNETLPVNVSGKSGAVSAPSPTMAGSTTGYMLLASVSFPSSDASYAGVSGEFFIRHGNGFSGNGTLAISFGEYGATEIKGIACVNYLRMYGTLSNNVKFGTVRKSSISFEIWGWRSGYSFPWVNLSAPAGSSITFPSVETVQAEAPTGWTDIPYEFKVAKAVTGTVGSTSNPMYVDSNGQVQPCGFSVNFGAPVSGAKVLNIVTA